MTFDPSNIFDRAEAAIARVLEKGRAFVGSGKVAKLVQEMANDAEIEIHVRARIEGGGWWVTLQEER